KLRRHAAGRRPGGVQARRGAGVHHPGRRPDADGRQVHVQRRRRQCRARRRAARARRFPRSGRRNDPMPPRIPRIPRNALALALAATLLAAAPVLSFAQATPAPAAAASMQGSPSQLVLDNTRRVLETIEARRAEFSRDRGALQQFVSSEFETMFDRDYAARQVLGRHGRGASDADVKAFGDALADNLMRRYGSSLIDFNTRLRVRIKSETALPRGLGVKVSSELLRQGGEPIPVDYLMRRSGSG